MWIWQGDSPWHFVDINKKTSSEIKKNIKFRRGFGSVKVEAKIGNTEWNTSIFPDAKRGVYLLPIKKQVREAESLKVGDTINLSIKVVS